MKSGVSANAGGHRETWPISKTNERFSLPSTQCSITSGAPLVDANNNGNDHHGEQRLQSHHTTLHIHGSSTSGFPRRKRSLDDEVDVTPGLDHEASVCSSDTGAHLQATYDSTGTAVVDGCPSPAFHTLGIEEQGEPEEAGLSLLFAASLMKQTEDNVHDDDDDDDDDNDFAIPHSMLFGNPCPHELMTRSTASPTFPQLSASDAPAPIAPAQIISVAAALPAAMRPPPQSFQTSVSPIPLAAAPAAPVETISEPTEYDVLCGRGGGINRHLGNILYRRVVDYNKAIYRSVPKRHRILVSQSIVQAILNHGGRFLQQQQSLSPPKAWTEIPFRRAVQKTSQALREQNKNEEASARDKVKGDSSSQDVCDKDNDEDSEEMRKPAARRTKR